MDEYIINKVLNTLTKEYESLVDSLKVQMDIKVGVNINNLKEKSRSKYNFKENFNQWPTKELIYPQHHGQE